MNDDLNKDTTGNSNWAQPVSRLKASQVPPGAINLNVEGRQVTGPFHGFGQLWQNTYRVRLDGVALSPEEVMQVWLRKFAQLQPPENHFHFSSDTVQPGDLIFIDTFLPTYPGSKGVIPLASGVMVMYMDSTSMTVITPEGHPEAGWNTFSTYLEDGTVIAQIQSYARAADPIYEFGLRFMGGARVQESTWKHVLTALANELNCSAPVEMSKVCLDPSLQWSAAKNVWKNAGLRTMLHRLSTPFTRSRGKTGQGRIQ